MAAGRPSDYESQVKPKIKFIKSLVRDGFSQEDITEFLGISKDTFYTYKKKHKEFSDCLTKENIIDEVEQTYINRLLGRYKATKQVFERQVDKETGETAMVLTREEKYEVPFNDGAYTRYLAVMRPEKWAIAKDDNALDAIVSAISKAVETNRGENDTD